MHMADINGAGGFEKSVVTGVNGRESRSARLIGGVMGCEGNDNDTRYALLDLHACFCECNQAGSQ
jgi:hypothetical protein